MAAAACQELGHHQPSTTRFSIVSGQYSSTVLRQTLRQIAIKKKRRKTENTNCHLRFLIEFTEFDKGGNPGMVIRKGVKQFQDEKKFDRQTASGGACQWRLLRLGCLRSGITTFNIVSRHRAGWAACCKVRGTGAHVPSTFSTHWIPFSC